MQEKQDDLGKQGGWVRTAYEVFMESEGIPIYQSMVGVHDVAELPRKPWARVGGNASFIQIRGMVEDSTGIYVQEIPGGGALNPEKHLYLEAIFILEGRGLTEVWQEGSPKVTFEWGPGSYFSPPLNAWHRLVNGTREPALFVAVTTAPGVMNAVRDTDFIFNSPHQFLDRFSGQADYFAESDTRKVLNEIRTVWATNFIPDVKEAFLDDSGTGKVARGIGVSYAMSDGFPTGHMSEWPVGIYHKAHHHGPGAMLLGLKGEGYVLLWPHEYGIHPYQDGHEDQVVKMEWKARSIYSPPTGWFHAHFNTSNERARHVAIYGALTARTTVFQAFAGEQLTLLTGVREGGSIIDYEDEDPQVRQDFGEALKARGIPCDMPEVVYQ